MGANKRKLIDSQLTRKRWPKFSAKGSIFEVFNTNTSFVPSSGSKGQRGNIGCLDSLLAKLMEISVSRAYFVSCGFIELSKLRSVPYSGASSATSNSGTFFSSLINLLE